MQNKDKIDKIQEVTNLIEKSLKTKIKRDEFIKLKELLNELDIISVKTIDDKVKELGFPSYDAIFDAIKDYKKQTPTNRLKVNEFLGEVSGSTVSTQMQIIKEYKQSKKGK